MLSESWVLPALIDPSCCTSDGPGPQKGRCPLPWAVRTPPGSPTQGGDPGPGPAWADGWHLKCQQVWGWAGYQWPFPLGHSAPSPTSLLHTCSLCLCLSLSPRNLCSRGPASTGSVFLCVPPGCVCTWLECGMQVMMGTPVHVQVQVLTGGLGGGMCVVCPFSVSVCKRQCISV